MAEDVESCPQERYDAANTGHAPDNTGPGDGLDVRWEFAVDAPVGVSTSVAGVPESGEDPGDSSVERTVYAGTVSPDDTLYAIAAADGSERWSFEAESAVSTPAVGDGTVYVGSYDGTVYALDADDGSVAWQLETGPGMSPPTLAGDTLYVGTGTPDCNLYAVSTDGEIEWAVDAADKVWSPAVVGAHDSTGDSAGVDGGTVYAGCSDGTLHALSAADGTQQWAFRGADSMTVPTVVDDTVYVGSTAGELYALSAADGSERWTFTATDSVGLPAVGDGTVYAGSEDDHLYAVDAADGSEEWSFRTGDGVWGPAVAGETVYVGSNDTNVYALDAADGTEQWHFETEDWVVGVPAVVDGTVYVGSQDGTVYALGD